MSAINDLYEIRNYRSSDKSFICSTFLKGLYYGNQFYNLIQKDAYMNAYKAVIEELISSGNIKVACLKEDPDVILGYSILSYDLSAIHFCFVKTVWRKQGIAKALTPIAPEIATHFTDLGLSLMKKLYPDCKFNPFYKELR